MIKRIIADEELICATALVRESMLRTLPEPEECTSVFTPQFEDQIQKLRKLVDRKRAWRRFAKGMVAAVLFLAIGFSMLFAFSTETRAAITGWLKKQIGTVTNYWTDASENALLHIYEETWIPDGLEIVQTEDSGTVRLHLYQHGNDISTGFVVGYWIAAADSPLLLDTFDGEYDFQQVSINGYTGDFYIARDPDVSSVLLWLDERTNTIITINAFYDKVDMLSIANGIYLVE